MCPSNTSCRTHSPMLTSWDLSLQIPISYLFVLETSAGQTWRIGTFRVIGTILGAVLACIVRLVALLRSLLTDR